MQPIPLTASANLLQSAVMPVWVGPGAVTGIVGVDLQSWKLAFLLKNAWMQNEFYVQGTDIWAKGGLLRTGTSFWHIQPDPAEEKHKNFDGR